MTSPTGTPVVEVTGPLEDRFDEILTPEALAFLAELHARHDDERLALLAARQRRQEEISAGASLDFPAESAGIRADPSWHVAGPGPGLVDRRVEITGPIDRKMTVNALNSGASGWLADFEDATAPSWRNVIGGQVNLFDAIRRQIDFTSPEGKEYRLAETTPTIIPRPRGWHLPEAHLRFVAVDGVGRPASGALTDFGLFFFHNAAELVARGSGPYFYLPKIEGRAEARLWDRVFRSAEELTGIAPGTIRATVLIETISAAFEMEEILFELRDHCAGLNAGRWDYIFSVIKKFRDRGPEWVLPDRSAITMTVPFMRAYTELLVSTCHRRGAHAIGGMSAFIPNRRDPEVTARALAQVRADKRREAGDGFDGSWVAHPDLVPVAREEFDAVLGDRPNQVDRQRDDVRITAADLLDIRSVTGSVTRAGVRGNVSVALRYIESWLRGIGAAAIDDLMEDAATAEISRSQLWQWIRHGVVTAEGDAVTRHAVERILDDVLRELRTAGGRFDDAAAILREVALGDAFPDFLTLPAYDAHFASEQTGTRAG